MLGLGFVGRISPVAFATGAFSWKDLYLDEAPFCSRAL